MVEATLLWCGGNAYQKRHHNYINYQNNYENNHQLPSNSENREHLKNFKNVDCVVTNHKKVPDKRANL